MADDDLTGDEATAKADRVALMQRLLDELLDDYEWHGRVISSGTPKRFIEDCDGLEGVRLYRFVREKNILHHLSKMTNNDKLRNFYKSLAEFLERLISGPIPSFIKDAPTIVKRTFNKQVPGYDNRKKAGRPQATAADQLAALREINAIAKLAQSGFIRKRKLGWNLHDRLGLTQRQFRYRLRQLGHNPRVEEIRRELRGFSEEEKIAEAEKRLDVNIGEFKLKHMTKKMPKSDKK